MRCLDPTARVDAQVEAVPVVVVGEADHHVHAEPAVEHEVDGARARLIGALMLVPVAVRGRPGRRTVARALVDHGSRCGIRAARPTVTERTGPHASRAAIAAVATSSEIERTTNRILHLGNRARRERAIAGGTSARSPFFLICRGVSVAADAARLFRAIASHRALCGHAVTGLTVGLSVMGARSLAPRTEAHGRRGAPAVMVAAVRVAVMAVLGNAAQKQQRREQRCRSESDHDVPPRRRSSPRGARDMPL